jgi:hypothetical protein
VKIFPERITIIQGSSSGGLFVGAYISAVPAPGANNDFNPGGVPAWPGTLASPYGRLDLVPVAACNLTGLKAGLDGQLVIIRNATAIGSGILITLNNLNGGSLAANQFSYLADFTLPPGDAQTMVYYAGSINKWVL